MPIAPFAVEMWMNAHENSCTWNLAETCVDSLTLAELLKLCGQNDEGLSALLPLKLTYGAIEGSARLRRAVAALYQGQSEDTIVTTHGTIGANALVHQALVEKGDRVIAIVPTYQQHTSIPEWLGADVQQLQLQLAHNFLPDVERLAEMARGGVKLIAMTNPNNPTGALMDRDQLQQIVDIARGAGAYLLCDEVYRGIDQTGSGTTASVADLYEKGISTASTSKAYSLAGLRLGWIAASRDVIEKVMIQRDYNTISAGPVVEHLAALALENSEKLLARSRTITRTNLALLAKWIDDTPGMAWVKPDSGTTALVYYGLDMPSRVFCLRLLREEGVLFTPGDCFGMEGAVRIGFGNSTEALRRGLPRVSAFLKRLAA